MLRNGRWMIAVALVAGGVAWCAGTGRLWAQAKPDSPTPTYQYVGVQQTIARVDLRTGRIEVLSQRGDWRASLLTRHPRPWRWRTVAVDEEPRAARSDDEKTGDRPAEPRATGTDEGSP